MTAAGKLIRGAVIAGSLGVLVACNDGGSGLVPTAPGGEKALVPASESSSTQSDLQQGLQAGLGGPIATVKCEKTVPPRPLTSQISVDGKNLTPGKYRARVTSPPGSNPIRARARVTVGDEVEFDFDSEVDPGETPIPANYIQIVQGGPDVQGEILSEAGAVVASQSVDCQVK
jgi:hypothetical protein